MIRKTNDPVMDKILQDLQKQIDELKKSVNSPMQKDGSHFRGKDGDMRFLKGANKKGYLEVYTADGVYTTVSDVFQLESRERMLPVFDEPTLTDGDIIAGTVRSTTSMTYARGIAGTEAGYWLGKYGTSDYRLFIGSSASKYFAYDNTDVKLVGGSVTAGAVKSSTTMTYDRGVAGTEFGYWLGNYGANDYRLFIGSSATKQFKYDNTDLTFLGGTITGGIVQTASGTGQRVVLSGATNTLTFYDSSNNATIVQGVAGASYNIDIDKPIRVQGIIYTTLGLDVGTSKLTIDSNGNITKLNNVTYSFPSVAPTLNQILKCTNATGGVLTWSDDSSSGTVTSVSVVTANGFAGTVATATTTPAITLTTSVTGLLKGNGTAISAASAGTDYALPNQTMYIGTTAVAINRGSGALALTGITSIDGNAATVTVANEASDTTCYLLFSTATSGSLAPKTNAALAFNSSTNVVTLTGTLQAGGGLTLGATSTLDASGGYLKVPTASGSVAGTLYYNSGLKYYNGLTVEEFAFAGQTMYIGTTAVTINRASAALTLAGITLTTPNIGTPSAGVLTNCTGTASGLTAGAVTNGVYTNANNALTGNNTTTGSVMLDGEVESTPGGDGNQSVSGKNTLIFYMTDAYTITITDPTDGQFLWVSNDKDSPASLVLTPVRNGANASLTLLAGNSVTLRYRSSESTWYSTGQ